MIKKGTKSQQMKKKAVTLSAKHLDMALKALSKIKRRKNEYDVILFPDKETMEKMKKRAGIL